MVCPMLLSVPLTPSLPHRPPLSIAEWLRPVADDVFKAECIACNTFLRCHKLKLRQHAKCKKHHLNMQVLGGRQKRRRQVTAVTPRVERRSFGRRVGGSSRGRGLPSRQHTAPPEQERTVLVTPQDICYGVSGRSMDKAVVKWNRCGGKSLPKHGWFSGVRRLICPTAVFVPV